SLDRRRVLGGAATVLPQLPGYARQSDLAHVAAHHRAAATRQQQTAYEGRQSRQEHGRRLQTERECPFLNDQDAGRFNSLYRFGNKASAASTEPSSPRVTAGSGVMRNRPEW